MIRKYRHEIAIQKMKTYIDSNLLERASVVKLLVIFCLSVDTSPKALKNVTMMVQKNGPFLRENGPQCRYNLFVFL